MLYEVITSPAVGYMALHLRQEEQLVKDAFEAEYEVMKQHTVIV